MYAVGNQNESKDYIYTLKIVNHCLDEEISYTGQAVPLQIGREEVIDISRCLIFDDKIAKRFCHNDSITFHIDIKRKNNQGKH